MGARLHTPDTLIPPPALALAAAAHYPKLLRFTLPEPRSESGEPISVDLGQVTKRCKPLGSCRNLVVLRRKYESFATVGEIRVYWRADFQSGSRVLKKVF